jgi:hypothetical protein
VEPPVTLLEFPPLPPEAPGEPEEEQPAKSATSRTEPSPRGSSALCTQLRGRRDVKCRSMVTPLKPGGSRRALALPILFSSGTDRIWPIFAGGPEMHRESPPRSAA